MPMAAPYGQERTVSEHRRILALNDDSSIKKPQLVGLRSMPFTAYSAG